ncbi:MAG: tetratricopeptide repeat protein [Chromatiales bacterium]|nr:tetratricopeptide repeat protein [Chromatiales bacterium]
MKPLDFDLLSRPDYANADLAESALLIAAEEYPGLSVKAELARVEAHCRAVTEQTPPEASPEERARILSDYLYRQVGFAGNRDDYNDPRNSFLNDVMDRRLGLPITLSVLHVAIGQRLGLDFRGISFPGHFIIRFRTGDRVQIIDPFEGGRILEQKELIKRAGPLVQDAKKPGEALNYWLSPADTPTIVVRMLRNLKASFLRLEKYEKAIRCIDTLLRVSPQEVEEIRDRGLVYERLECHRAAAEDYGRYLAMSPDAEDADQVHQRFLQARSQAARLH